MDQLPDKPIDPGRRRQGQDACCVVGGAPRAAEGDRRLIARNAEVESLYDRPYKARGVVRVAGPFTVESLSPHRVLPMGEDPYLEELLAAARRRGGGPGSTGARPRRRRGRNTTDFAQVVYENLKTAGVQNTKKGERSDARRISGRSPHAAGYDPVRRASTSRRARASAPRLHRAGIRHGRLRSRAARGARGGDCSTC